MHPHAFMALTPHEFELMREGWVWREEHLAETLATWVAVLINNMGWSKTRLTPQRLLGRPLRHEREAAARRTPESSAQE